MRFVLLAALLLLNVATFSAFSQTISSPASQAAVILILDVSGSMEKNDPDGLRFTGARLFSSLLEPGDSAGIIFFSTQSSVETDALMLIQNERDKAALLQRIQDRPADGYTDVKAAFLSARDLLQQANLSGQAVYIVFLTDGKPEIENLYQGYEEDTLELAKSLGVPILSIALTSSAQTPFLDRLARETGGRVIGAEDASDLLDAYLSIFGQIKDRTVLAASPGYPSFFLDPELAPYINSMSFILSKSAGVPARLYSPAGEAVQPDSQDVRFFFEDPGFITMNLGGPVPGTWTFEGFGKQEVKAYVILHSRLRVEMISPGIHHQQSRPMLIEVRMTEELEGGNRVPIIGDATFTAVVTLPDSTQESLDLLYDDGTHGDRVAGDGIFSRLYVNTHQVDTYAIEILGRKAEVPVDYLARVEVIPFPELILQEPSGNEEFDGEPLQVSVFLKDTGGYSLESGDLIAVISSPSGSQSEINLVNQGAIYAGSFVPVEEGIYKIQITGKAAVYRGLPYEETLVSQVEVKFVRTLHMEAGGWIANGCFDRRGHVPVRFDIFTPQAEIIRLNVSDVDGLQAYPTSIKTKGGAEKFLIEMTMPSGKLSPGAYQFQLEPESSSTLELQPIPANFTFQVPNVYQRCGSVFRWGGLAGLVLLIAALLVTRKMRLAAMPALLTGTLRYWQKSGSGSSFAQEYDLTLFSKNTILVGRSADCDIRLSDPGLDAGASHFALTAEKTDDGTQVVLRPLGETWKGYSKLRVPVILHHGDIFRIKNLNFQYLSDSGN